MVFRVRFLYDEHRWLEKNNRTIWPAEDEYPFGQEKQKVEQGDAYEKNHAGIGYGIGIDTDQSAWNGQ